MRARMRKVHTKDPARVDQDGLPIAVCGFSGAGSFMVSGEWFTPTCLKCKEATR